MAVLLTVWTQSRSQMRYDSYTVPIRTELSLVDADTLRVVYRADAPLGAIALRRVPDDKRLTRWTSEDEAVEIVHEDDRDYIRRVDGSPFTQASFVMPVTYTDLPKDYAPFMPFGDGSLMIHSGRFQPCEESCKTFPAPPVFPMVMTPPEGARIILNGEIIEGIAGWGDTRDGTMVYVGNAEPIETDELVAVVDPSLPADIRQRLDEFFPELMHYYSERLGKLEEKPMLFAALDRYAEPDNNPYSNSYSSQGGTLPGQVFMHLVGDGWLEAEDVRGDQTTGFLAWFFAHEAGHLYQRGHRTEFDMAESWIHEGGADAFASLAMQDLDGAPDSYVLQRSETAVEECVSGLEKGPLRDAIDRGDFGLFYSCGMVIQLAADRSIRQRSNGQADLFDLWAVYLDEIAAGAPWEEATFLSLVGRMGGDDAQSLALDILGAYPQVTRERLRAALGLPDPAPEGAGAAGAN